MSPVTQLVVLSELTNEQEPRFAAEKACIKFALMADFDDGKYR